MKKIIFATGLFLLFFAKPAFGADEVINYDTGSSSENVSAVFTRVVEKTINTNNIKLSNVVDGEVMTGENSASFNTGNENQENYDPGIGGGEITTGNASFSVLINNNVNTNKTNPEPEEKPEEVDPVLPDGIGGGGEEVLVAAEETTATLPAAGPNEIDRLATLLGLPMIAVMLIRIAELLAKKKSALYK